MSEWVEFKIEDLAEVHNQKRVPLSSMQRAKRQGPYPYYGASGIIDHVDDYLFDGEYVLVSEDGENLKSRKTPIAFKATGKFWVNNHAHILRGKKSYVNDLLIYYFQNLDLHPYVTGAVQPKLNKANLLSITVLLPKSDKEQEAITAVLASLDDKIDLLHRQNKTLESLAQTLFRHWFVDGEQKEWKKYTLEEFVEVMRGLSYKGAGLTEEGEGLPMHNLNSVYEGGGYKHEGIKYYKGKFKDRHKVFPGDVIVTNTEQGHEYLLIGYPAVVPRFFGEEGIFSHHIYHLKIHDDRITRQFLYYLLMSHDVHEQIASATNGSTVNMLPKDGIEWATFKLPPPQLIKKFSETVKQHWNKQEANYVQIRTLEKLRDTLLPKLMSGEVRVRQN